MQSLISVIIPVYQVVNYLEKCIDSVLKQSYNNLEIILVDDGSTDGGERICDRYAEEDTRVKVIHQSNKGLSVARNTGIENATGDYLFFVDSDDILPIQAVQVLYDAIIKFQADIALGSYIQFSDKIPMDKSISILRQDNRNKTEKLYIEHEQMKAFFGDPDYPEMAWGKLYRREVFENIRYPVGKLYEDEYTTYKLLDCSKKSIFIPEIVYGYRDNPNGIMRQKYNSKTIQAFEAVNEQVNFTKEKYPDCVDLARCKLVFTASRCGLWMIQTGVINKGEVKRYQEAVRQNLMVFLTKGKNRIHTKIFAMIYAINPQLLYPLFQNH